MFDLDKIEVVDQKVLVNCTKNIRGNLEHPCYQRELYEGIVLAKGPQTPSINIGDRIVFSSLDDINIVLYCKTAVVRYTDILFKFI